MSSPSPPYRLGNWDLSMIGKSSFEMVAGPLPTTLILACVAGDKAFVNAQKIHVSTAGTETKNFLCYREFRQNLQHPESGVNEQGAPDNGQRISCSLVQLLPSSSDPDLLGCSHQRNLKDCLTKQFGGMRQTPTMHLHHTVNLFKVDKDNSLFHQTDTPSV